MLEALPRNFYPRKFVFEQNLAKPRNILSSNILGYMVLFYGYEIIYENKIQHLSGAILRDEVSNCIENLPENTLEVTFLFLEQDTAAMHAPN